MSKVKVTGNENVIIVFAHLSSSKMYRIDLRQTKTKMISSQFYIDEYILYDMIR